MKRSHLVDVVVLAACATLACSQPTAANEAPPGPRAVLFIGNSLTYSHDIPQMVRALAVGAGEAEPPTVHMVAEGGYSLEDHWHASEARRQLARGGWWRVVLQQGPSALPESRVNLREWGHTFAGAIRAAGAEPAFYSVWPDQARAFDFDASIESYRLAAADNNALFLPAGRAWQLSLRDNPQLRLYSADGLHPTPAGAYLSALVIYARLHGRSPVGLPPRLSAGGRTLVELSTADAALLQQAALAALNGS